MPHIDWFVEKMKSEFHMEVPRDEVSYEAYEFYHDEIDNLLVPAAHLEKLPNPMLLEALMYVDKEGYEWIAGVVIDEETRKMLYEVWIKDGEQIACKLYV
ncbi:MULTISPECIES: hypothetical protein [unclassified Geobacillus]|uniref:hypothetical protein n=1 Tax=unclassified Geobacillus TaxID=2642459 RepID=UPI000C29365B|nr:MULTISPECIES: hypothetical protein [unclassified Geobacillus]PJW13933.1 hypothetical protein CV945_11505 [Geobacillus sp. Manikaran-105]PJW16934.1 hypothetical protein CV944_11875 [Geobacillus sp. WSUCF-018B]